MSEFATGSDFAGFRIERVIGRGGMGIVYLAGEPELDRLVALKVIRSDVAHDRAFRRRFASESRAAAAIEHPNVVSVYRAGEHRGRPYLAMRYVEGRDLQARLAAERRLRPNRAASLIHQVAQALDAIHAAGLVHRDVKPANIIVSDDGGTTAYLTDFGLAKAAAEESGLTRTGEVIGSLDYLAPEQIEGRRVDARTDVYALGSVLFQLLTGRVPFPDRESSAKLWAHLNEPPPSVELTGDRALAQLDAVVRRAMAKDPDDRFPSAGDLGRAALGAATGTTVAEPEHQVGAGDAAPETARVPPDATGTTRTVPTEVMPPRGRRRRRPRKRGRLWAAALLVLALLAGGVFAATELREDGDPDSPAAEADPVTVELPALEGQPLDLTEQELSELGLRSETVGGGVLGVVVPANWEVCETDPSGGEQVRPGATVRLLIDRPGAC